MRGQPYSPAVLSLAGRMGGFDVGQQRFIANPWPASANLLRRSRSPRCSCLQAHLTFKVAAGADAEHFALQRDRPLPPVPFDPGVLHVASHTALRACRFF